ncbi:zinc ribbon domain-containing protein, partial [Oscillibacter sp.]|uniref:zinc ribbon domain-containing protein n=1 Tax=Oscillibacter sp. TaxID=1945593 RepID=UPI00289B6A2B
FSFWSEATPCRLRQGKRRPNKMGEQDMLSGLVECEACGTKLYLCRCGSWNEEQYTYTCGRYHKHKDECTPPHHQGHVTAPDCAGGNSAGDSGSQEAYGAIPATGDG